MFERKVKRGETSWGYFILAFGILFPFGEGIISFIEVNSFIKASIFLIYGYLLFYFCFSNNWFRNKIVGFFTKLKEKWEKH